MKTEIIMLMQVLHTLLDQESDKEMDYTKSYNQNVSALKNTIAEAIDAFAHTPENYDEPLFTLSFEKEINIDDNEIATTLDDIESEIAMYNSIIYNANTSEDRRNIAREYLSIAEFHKSLKQSIGVNKQYSEWVKDNELS